VYLRKAVMNFKSELMYPFLFSGFTVQYMWVIISPIVEGGVPVIIISMLMLFVVTYVKF